MAISRLASNAARQAGRAQRAFLAQGVAAGRSGAGLAIDAARENARINSYPQATGAGVILAGVDVGGGHAKATIANHDRIYPVQGGLEVPNVSLAGIADVTHLDDGVTLIANGSALFLYYIDTTLAGLTPVVKATLDPKAAQSASAPGQHYLGKVTTPAGGAGPTSGGGGRPPGFDEPLG